MTDTEPHDIGPQPPAQRLLDRLLTIAGALSVRNDALALLALGSVGRETARIDAWSDLDFFVLVRPGAKPRYLADLDWLAAARPLAWVFRNTADGCKALMDDGVYCELAVFEPAELAAIPYAPGRWVWRRDEVDAALAAPQRPLPAPPAAAWLIGEALSNLLVGLGRHARGEKLAALRLVQGAALDRLLELAEQQDGPAGNAPRDPFGVERRIEQRLPALAARLSALAPGYDATPAAALALLAELQRRATVPAPLAQRIRTLADMQT